MANTPDQVIGILEDIAQVFQKAKVNLKKCPKERLTVGYLESRIKSIDEYWNSFKEAHQNLIKCTTREQRSVLQYFVNEEFYIQEDVYLYLQGYLKDMLSLKTKSEKSDKPENRNSSACSDNSPHALARLPRIQLPTFSGSYEDWPTFQDLFTSLVHHDTSRSQVQKLHYLKTSITGEAAALLKHLQITSDNYTLAWDTLHNRYGNRRIIVNSLLKRLFLQKKHYVQSAKNLKTILDTTSEILKSLENMNISTDSWDPVTIYLVVQKLDPESHRQWEEYSYKESSEELPTWEDLKKFLESKFRTLELVAPTLTRTMKEGVYHVTSPSKTCIKCKGDHTLSHCTNFSKLTANDRSLFVKENKICYNCLIPGHTATTCRVPQTCRICHKRHHSLLHQPRFKGTSDQRETLQPTTSEDNEEELQVNNARIESKDIGVQQRTALLATALVKIKDDYGNTTLVKALVDNGSQASFISERAAQSLRLKRTSINGTISGIGSTRTNVKHATELQILSRNDEGFKLKTKTYIMPTRLTTQLPTRTISTNIWPHIKDLVLADPSFNQPGRVDMLLGVDVCAQIMKSEVIKGPPGTPCAQNTSLGWILFGSIQEEIKRDDIISMHINLNLDEMLKQMWEQNTDEKRLPTPEERKCEEIYKTTTTRTDEGRYIVKLPMKTETPLATEGETRDIALKRFKLLEKRFHKNPNLKLQYSKVMSEYKEQDHMEEVPNNEINKPSVYLPHHPVIRDDKETTKVRVVFDASCKGTNNISINDELLVGPQLQEDMRNLIIRWRLKRICFIADIQQMYRQILVTQQDADYQRILWRQHENEPIKDYRLLRVTFGTSCAPYLAVKTLQQIAEDEGNCNQKAANVIKTDFFMDDLMSGEDTLQEAIDTAKAIQQILNKGGFKLQKWASNSVEFLNEFHPSERSSHVNININVDGIIRALGLTWNMGKDLFQYHYQLPTISETITKRIILAEIQRLFDPLGWLAPAIIPAKLMVQKLWLQAISWDDELDPETKREWVNIRRSLEYITCIKINRWLYTTKETMKNVTIHGYCDASVKAYGAVAYLRVETENEKYNTYIIAAKTKVAPLKALSLPRLELCGAVLLSKLLKQISEATRIPTSQIYCWTDSTIVLSWLQGDANRWQTFVRNRVITILDNIGNKWYHVQSNHNPADIASRGMLAPELKNCSMWWHGPEHLKHKEIIIEKTIIEDTELEKIKTMNTYLSLEEDSCGIYKQFEKIENLNELLRTIIYAKRFLNYKKIKNNLVSSITTEEIESSLLTCIKISQHENFNEEIQYLQEKGKVKNKNILKNLNPFLDTKNILRVGGRIQNSDLDYNQKHPIILHDKCPLTLLIIAEAHRRTLHGGVQLMMNYLRSRYWILKLKKLVKIFIHRCMVCAKVNARARTQMMGELPKERVTPARAFLHTGVDFSGPFDILMSKGRGAKTKKSYVSIFVCMSTKAVHLELVGDLTSEAFIGAFRRFIARRGRCTDLWSDQGRNFIGANKELSQAFKAAKLEFNNELFDLLASDGTQWHFIPAYSPNFGGLWEAGVKSMKYHLKRVMNTHLTYEEMTTVLCQVEACLNSRPLCPVDTTNYNELDVLTPGHFLIGESLISIPSPSLADIPLSHLSRWQFTQRLLSYFWKQWQQEYLARLQQRPKWLKRQEEFDIGQIVIIKTEGLPPGKWHLGRIVSKHPGPDGITRVYSVKSGNNIVKRSISKLCFLPVNSKDE